MSLNNLFEDQFESSSRRSTHYFKQFFTGTFFNNAVSTAQVFKGQKVTSFISSIRKNEPEVSISNTN
jgi:hypothetical protein